MSENFEVLAERVKGVDGKVDALMHSVTELNKAMTIVAKLEVKNENTAVELAALRLADGNASKRLEVLEGVVPTLVEMKSDVIWLRRIIVGAVVVAILGLVLVKTGA